MKNLSNHIAEGLLDKDFDVPDFNTETIIPNMPFGVEDGETWRDIVTKMNEKLLPFKYLTKVNTIIDMAAEVVDSIKRDNISASHLGRFGQALEAISRVDHLKADENIFTEANNVRALNDWIGKANHDAAFRKLVSGLGGYFYAHIGERNVRSGSVYGAATYTLTSPNENAQLQLIKFAEKLSKINKSIDVTFRMNGEGDGIFSAKLMKHAS